MKTDAEDLRSFASHGDQAAFRRIVERHAPMVHGVAWRRMQNRGMAEDVTQNVFIVLARKARFIPHHELAGWLYRTAYMETLNASRKEAVQRSAIEHLTAMTHPPAPAPPEWTGISPHLDEVISQLPPADRQLVVMRYFEQRNYREICQTTGHSEPAVRKRMQRALDRLGVLLKRRGVTTSGTALGAVLTVQTLCTPPASAAIIATVALNAMPAAGGISLFTTLYLMTTQSALKTAAAALVLAAIPTAIFLGHRDAAPAAASSSAKPSAATDTASTSRTEPGFNPEPDGRDAQRKVRPDRPAAASKIDDELTISAKSLFDHVEMVGMTEKDNLRLANRLTHRLNLSADQQAKLSAYLEQHRREKSEELKQMLSGSDIKISTRGIAAGAAAGTGSDATADANASSVASFQIAGLAGSSSDNSLNEFLGSILTPEQQGTNNAYVEEERQDAARRTAQGLVDDFSKYIDLTPAQKDQLYEQASHHPAASDDNGNASDPIEAAKQILTPDQLATYDAGKQEDQAGAPGITTGTSFIQARSASGIQTILSTGGK